MTDHFRKLEQMYAAARCNAYFAPTIHIDAGRAEVTIPVREDFYHAANAVHGSVYFKLMDDASFFSAASLIEDVMPLTASFTLYFLMPVTAGTMRAVGKVVTQKGSQLIAEAVVYDSDDVEIARGMGSFIRSKIPLSAEIGYR
jgi:uncharacterized protein (TIGR00369 family)